MWGDILLWFWFAFPWWWIKFEHLFIYVLIICMSFEKCLFRSSPPPPFLSQNVLFLFLLSNCMSSLYILDINPLSDMLFANISCCPVGCFFFTLFLLLCTYCLIQVHLSIFIFDACTFGVTRQEIIAKINVKKLSSMFSSSSFTV